MDEVDGCCQAAVAPMARISPDRGGEATFGNNDLAAPAKAATIFRTTSRAAAWRQEGKRYETTRIEARAAAELRAFLVAQSIGQNPAPALKMLIFSLSGRATENFTVVLPQ